MYAKKLSFLHKLLMLQKDAYTHPTKYIQQNTRPVGRLPARCVVAAALMLSLGQTAPSAASEGKQ